MPEQGEPLSEREFDVLECLAEGAANKEIASELSISPNTVKVHLRNIYTKLGASSRTEAVRIALEQGTLALPNVENDTAVFAEDGRADEAAPPADADLPSSATAVVDTPVVTDENATSLRWRLISLLLFLALVAIIAGLVGFQALNGSIALSPQATPTPFIESELGDNWLVSRSMPTPTTGMATAAVGLHLYQIGGETADGVIPTVKVFDTVSREWQNGTDKPTAVADADAAVLFGEIYVPGGRLADNTPTDVVEVYSPANDAWRTVASLPHPISGGLALSDGSFLYVFGGWDGERYLDTAYVYDSGANSWRPLTPMRQPRAFAAGALIAGELFAVGGRNADGDLALCELFQPGAEMWQPCPPMLTPRVDAGATTLVNKLYVIGGTTAEETAVSLGEVYDPKDGTWQFVNTPMQDDGLAAWMGLGVTLVETRIYASGGRQGSVLIPDLYVYEPLAFRTYLPATSGGGN